MLLGGRWVTLFCHDFPDFSRFFDSTLPIWPPFWNSPNDFSKGWKLANLSDIKGEDMRWMLFWIPWFPIDFFQNLQVSRKKSHQIMQIPEKHDNRFAFSSHKNSVSGETFHFQKNKKLLPITLRIIISQINTQIYLKPEISSKNVVEGNFFMSIKKKR